MHLSENRLTNRQKQFLKSENPVGFNKSQFQDDISDKLDFSMTYLYHIAHNQKNLRKDDVYDKLNALTLYGILNRLLEVPGSAYANVYDFRSIELARMLFELSTLYLKQHHIIGDNKWAIEEIDKLSQRYTDLAKSILEKEQYDIISEDEVHNLDTQLHVLQRQLDAKRNNPKDEHYKYSKEYDRIVDKALKLDDSNKILQHDKEKIQRETAELTKSKSSKVKRKKLTMKVSKIEKEIKKNTTKYQELLQESRQVQKLRDSSIAGLEKKIHEIGEKLSHQYDHLKNCFCLYKPLTPFNGSLNPHLPEKHPNQLRGGL